MTALRLRINLILDALNLAVAGSRDSIAALITLYLVQTIHLNTVQLAQVLAIPGLAYLFTQIPLGFVYDRAKDKRGLLALGASLMLICAFGMSISKTFGDFLFLELLSGVALCLFGLGVPALSLLYSPVKTLGRRLARNEVWAKVGSFGIIAMTGYIAHRTSLASIFSVSAVCACVLAVLVFFLPRKRQTIRSEAALKEKLGLNFFQIIKAKEFLILLSFCFIFQFANASMLMIFEQSFARTHANGAGVISTAIVISQVVLVGTGLLIGRRKNGGSYISLFRLGFLLITVRGFMFVTSMEPTSLMMGQVLDGVIGAIMFIAPGQAVATMNPKHFNIMIGTLGTCASLGVSLSILAAGHLLQFYSAPNTYLFFMGLGIVGFIFSFLFSQTTNALPEIRKRVGGGKLTGAATPVLVNGVH